MARPTMCGMQPPATGYAIVHGRTAYTSTSDEPLIRKLDLLGSLAPNSGGPGGEKGAMDRRAACANCRNLSPDALGRSPDCRESHRRLSRSRFARPSATWSAEASGSPAHPEPESEAHTPALIIDPRAGSPAHWHLLGAQTQARSEDEHRLGGCPHRLACASMQS